ncbi:MAG: multicopper oxidase domain-containing protein [Crocosphaera sp.]|nr:multicopper oxidase domain-containing protein [Crocosphaera sp.]
MTELNNEQNSLETSEDNSVVPNLSRRALIGSGIAAAAAFAWPSVVNADTERSLLRNAKRENRENRREEARANRPSQRINIVVAQGQPFSQPPTWSPSNGLLNLNMVESNVSMANGTNLGVFRTFQNGGNAATVPGPTLVVNDGDNIQILLSNQLSPNPINSAGQGSASQNDPYCGWTGNPNPGTSPQCFNTSNLHFHGLHVSPSTTSGGIASDDVLLTLQPGQQQQYCVQLPVNHAPGTHWYHPHHHGSTAAEVSNALAGVIVIKEKPGQEIYQGADDSVWVIQELILNGNPQTKDINLYGGGGGANKLIVNGQDQPVFNIKPNSVHRFRFVNATSTPRGFMTLQLKNATNGGGSAAPAQTQGIYRVAIDGITFYGSTPEAPPTVNGNAVGYPLASGNRSDFIVCLPAGTYELWNMGSNLANASNGKQQLLATIVVDNNGTGSTVTTQAQFAAWAQNPIPTTGMPAYLSPITTADLDPGAPQKTVNLTIQNPGNIITAGFGINGTPYNPQNPPIQVNLDAVQQWSIVNATNAAHPFHIHVNPFQVQDYTGQFRWYDTYAIPKQQTVPIQHRFDDYAGKYVLHCHILIHEDVGMMQEVQVNDQTGSGTGPCQPLTLPLALIPV